MTDPQGLNPGGIVASTPDDTVNNTVQNSVDMSAVNVNLIKIDTIIVTYLTDIIKPTIEDNGKSIPVPVLFGDPERWKAIRKDGYVRDKFDKLQIPVIVLRRTNVRRNPLTSPVNKYLSKIYESGWNRHNSYDKFNVLNHITPSREFFSVTIPDYVDLSYEVVLWTEYREQMNKLVEQINFEVDEYWGKRDDFKFRVSVEDYADQSDLPTTQDRVIRTAFTIMVKAYLLAESTIANTANLTQTTKKLYGVKKTVKFTEIDGERILGDS